MDVGADALKNVEAAERSQPSRFARPPQSQQSRGESPEVREIPGEPAVDSAGVVLAEAGATLEKDDGLAYRDPWDEPGAVRQYDPADPLAPYREGKAVPLQMPDSVMNFSEEDTANLSDFGHIAAREGWTQEFAQAIVDQVAADFRSEKSRPDLEGHYNPERTISELRFEFGAETEAILGRVEAYCAKRPALAAYLDATGLGNSPSVIRLLAAVASDESIVTKAGAKKFIENLGKNTEYWKGSKLEVAKSRIAFMLSDGK